ncbi:hypothetical protein C3747_29g85 [Trypanosoma cruzi]|uniref:Uncharacterized protein n=3 Tax=Trypanosoma cruzi TaxID=5693 RepID=Q4DPU0_TRYCC|nr:hypothetical protein, conserved [Trypanosoma cruzi]EAN94560.1 hypothetical protein, conserved [Trypanosoma cruzi]PWV15521.1 hypothetical protein C3747_29g85 [Trypanosoma cruzi]RNC55570.1 hypothetical protein TcCL_ESM06922 [Trypanosoma cruzi]|eukprot:XP_816411.1 hypothetical protein [Trypanosoma cruzi strain CL Brener]
MLSLDSYVYPRGGAAASFSSPLMDCTSAIHNSDNIQNGAPHFTTVKSVNAVASAGIVKETTYATSEPQRFVFPIKHTNNPYTRTSADGSPCVPTSPLSAEVRFLMSYKDEDTKGLNTLMSTSNEPRMMATVAKNSCSALQGPMKKGVFPPAPRSSTIKQSAYRSPPFVRAAAAAATAPTTPTVMSTNPISTESTLSSTHATARRLEIPNTRTNALHQSPHTNNSGSSAAAATTTTSTSVTHVRCKRVYVNGRPMTVWLNGNEHSQ